MKFFLNFNRKTIKKLFSGYKVIFQFYGGVSQNLSEWNSISQIEKSISTNQILHIPNYTIL